MFSADVYRECQEDSIQIRTTPDSSAVRRTPHSHCGICSRGSAAEVESYREVNAMKGSAGRVGRRVEPGR
jgi:hypothetical protein